ncbi:hypothetical protein POX_b03400 [Penicillium oxalicum]|uniref:hypothetical protein n=1 Tax=Penicillium oxalicum TaxID=69781 RepID=UPI0020B78187|nr:hypothetical protein POX_b03400 [Penicillium oxalicum]KAI2793346.1 hypothetical protein POX_b03400 [Penicillium oxalicum]
MAEVNTVTVYNTVQRTTVAEATPTAPKPASYTSLEVFHDTMLRVTNDFRKLHEAKPLTWNDELAEYSRKWAEGCLWKHSDGPYGENLAFGYPNASAAVDAWADEVKYYNFKKPTGFTEETGHFTQLVWQSTTEVGCAAVNCGYGKDKRSVQRGKIDSRAERLLPRDDEGDTRAQGWFVVCEYKPPGNIVGEDDKYFKENVKPANQSSASASTTASDSQATGGTMAKAAGSPRSWIWTTLVAWTVIVVGMSLYS